MKRNFSPSVNILRDTEKDLHYIPTPNGKKIVNQIVDDFKKGIRSFNIIGNYGTGKSSFLLALEQSIKSRNKYFDVNIIDKPRFDVIKIVGSYKSLIDAFKQELDLHADIEDFLVEKIFAEIYNRYHDLGRKAPLLFIEIDEFGKFLEYAAQNNPERELYFIQQLAEFVNNAKYNIVLITTIHQSFESYGFSLSSALRQEWAKVKGRFKEITFNEPVEQLLFLASEHIAKTVDVNLPKNEVNKVLKLFKYSKAFNYNEASLENIGKKIYPLDLFAAHTLTISLQRYGQNERSLFSFLEGSDDTSLEKFIASYNSFYNLAHVYDYLSFNFYNFLTSPYNPHFAAWSSIRSSLEVVERTFATNLSAYFKLIKTIGLLNIHAAAGSIIDKKFLVEYGTTCLKIENVEAVLEELEQKKIVLFRDYSHRYILFEGTDLDIQSALIEAGNKVNAVTDIKSHLQRYYDLPPVLAKEYSYKRGTPRYFSFVISEEPINEIPSGEVDGFINLIFNEKLTQKKIKEASFNQKEAIIYGYYRNASEIKSLLFDILKTQQVLTENKDDRIAKKELENIILHKRNLLNHYIINSLFGEKAEVKWFWNGEERKLNSKKEFNKLLSESCDYVYGYAPVFKNELVNKHKISASINTAKRSFLKALINDWDKPNLGFEEKKFPPEKMIYVTLIKENGLLSFSDEVKKESGISSKSSFYQLWKASLSFLNNTKDEKKNLALLIEKLQKRPFRLKQGLIDFWIPTFLFLKRNDIALFGRNGFVPEINLEIFDLISKAPQTFWVKSINVEGVKLDIFNSYRLFLNQETKEQLSNQTFIETIKPFLVFHKQLPEYSKTTRRLSKEAIALREAIVSAQDPEKAFFEDFPLALGTSINQLKKDKEALHDYITTLQNAIREIRGSYEALVDRFEGFIKDEVIYEDVPFEVYKLRLQERFKSLKRHLLLPKQKTFVQRLDSAIEDKYPWLSSICQAIIGKSLEAIKDDDEPVLFDKFKSFILELDSLTDLSSVNIDESKEEVLGFQFDSFVDGIRKSLVRLPKTKTSEVEDIKSSLQASLSKDKTLNIAAVANLLKELMQNE